MNDFLKRIGHSSGGRSVICNLFMSEMKSLTCWSQLVSDGLRDPVRGPWGGRRGPRVGGVGRRVVFSLYSGVKFKKDICTPQLSSSIPSLISFVISLSPR